MSEALAIPGNRAATFLTRFFEPGLAADDRYCGPAAQGHGGRRHSPLLGRAPAGAGSGSPAVRNLVSSAVPAHRIPRGPRGARPAT